jgi:predicted ester cyclase
MSPRSERNKQLVRAYVRSMVSDDPEGPFRFVAPGFHLSGGVLTGDLDRAGAVAWRKAVLGAFPDLTISFGKDALVAEGDRVALKVRWTGTHLGAYQGIPPTSRRVDVTLLAFFLVRNGLILSETHLTDSLALVEQMRGEATAAPPSPPAKSPSPPASLMPGPTGAWARFFVPPENLAGLGR